MRLYYSYWGKLSSDKIRARKIPEKFVGRIVLTINKPKKTMRVMQPFKIRCSNNYQRFEMMGIMLALQRMKLVLIAVKLV